MVSEELLMKFDYMYKDYICTSVTVYKGGRVVVNDFTDNIFLRPFGNWSNKVKFENVIDFFDSRCLPNSRYNIDSLLEGKNFSSLWIIRNINHGVMAGDEFWIRFEDEKDLTWSEVSKILNL